MITSGYCTMLVYVSKFQTEDIKEIAIKIATLPQAGDKKSRTVVITQGKDPTLVVQGYLRFAIEFIQLTIIVHPSLPILPSLQVLIFYCHFDLCR
jgi:hypothetical protein